jgi:class 3 adenylate cyclase/tetratricopeptide (TPR) repeat protein
VSTCPFCGAASADDARFCSRCGRRLGHACAECGAPLEESAAFCPQCGTRVAAPTAGGPAGVTSFPAQERKVVTVLFADLSASTSLAEQLDPEQMADVLRTYFDAMREAIEAEGGTVEKFIGDAVMAVFGVPVAHEDDPARALRATGRMTRQLELVNAMLGERYDVTLAMRVGVNTGSVLAATDPPPGEPMVTGDVVNVAARLQSAAGVGEVLVSERTARAARTFGFVDRGDIGLRGRHEEIRAFALASSASGSAGGSERDARGVPGLHAPMIGRDGEMAMLTGVAQRVARERRPHLVTIYGEAGVGKSRLVRELVEWLQTGDPPPLVLRGRCLPYGDGITYWPLAEILKGHAGVLDTHPPATALARIRSLLARLLGDDPDADARSVAAALAYTVGIGDPDIPLGGLDPRVVRRRVHAAWLALFSALASMHPVVVVVEDIHWADPALLDLLDELAEQVLGPVLFLCPTRPELVATRPNWGGGRRNSLSVSLDRLDLADAELLVRSLLAIDDLPSSVHTRILERAEGNPFFLEEILRRLIDEGMVVRDGDRWRARPGIEDVQIPDTVQGVLAARIDLLEPADKQVLQAAAVVGRVFWTRPVELLVAAARGAAGGEDSGGNVEDALERLEVRDLVQRRRGLTLAGEHERLFTHILTRDVAYASIPVRDRGDAHAVVAGWLEQSAGDRSGELAELLAYHYATAVAMTARSGSAVEDPLRVKAFTWLLRASEAAGSTHALSKAQRLARDALDLASTDLERITAMSLLGQAYDNDTRGDLAWQTLREAALLAERTRAVDDVVTAGLIARACVIPVRWPGSMRNVPAEEQVRALHERGLRLAPSGDSPERARLLSIKSAWPFAYPASVTAEDLPLYQAAGQEAADIARRLGDADLESGALDNAAAAYSMHGTYRAMLPLWQRRWGLRDRLTVDQEIGDLHAMGAWIHWELGHYQTSIDIAGSIAHTQEMGGSVHARAWQVAALFRLGRWDEVLAPFDELRDRLGDRRDSPPYYAAHAYAMTGLVHTLRGENLEGDRLMSILRTSPQSVRSFAWYGLMLLAHGDYDDAAEFLAEPPPAWEVHESVVWEARCDAALALLARKSGQPPAAAYSSAELPDRCRAFAVEAGTPSLTCFADRLGGAQAGVAGDLARAATLLQRARDGFGELGICWERARTERLLADVLERIGQPDRASEVTAAAAVETARLRVTDDLVIRDVLGT